MYDGSAPSNLLDDGMNNDDLRLIIDSVRDYAIYMIDSNGYVRSWNPGGKNLHGYCRHEIVGRHFSLLYPAELVERHCPDQELRIAAEEGRFENEDWRIRKDGSRFRANVVISPLRNDGDGGQNRGFSLITRDVSERHRQEELLRHSEERFRLLVQGVRDYAIFMLDPSGHVMSWNEGARFNKGYRASEIIGRHFSVFYPHEVAASGWPDTELRLAMENGRYEEEGWRVRKDGTRFWANVVITALFDASGRHRGFAKVTRDLTEKHRVRTLEDEGRRITSFVSMLAHELRNPLAPIANAVAVIGREQGLPAAVEMAHGIITRQVRQLTRLVDDLLDISRISAGKLQLESKPVRLDEVLLEAVEAIQPAVDAKQHTLALDLHPENLWVSGDRARLIQVFANLLHNAARFTPDRGRIEAMLSVEAGDAVMRVRDNGPGIPAERLPTLFNRYSQAEDDSSKIFGGLGLGLSLAHQLTTLQGGSIDAASSGRVGEGSEFTVRLPLVETPNQPAGDVAQRPLLVVDDNRDTADTLALLLGTMGHQVVTAYSGLQAIEQVKREHPRVVLLDIGLPDIDGVEVAKRLATEIASPPLLIAVTGYGMERDRERSFSSGFHAHLTKPVDPERLCKLLASILD